jgi:hypothetical protein
MWYFPGETEKKNEKLVRIANPQARLEPQTYQIQSKSVTHLTTAGYYRCCTDQMHGKITANCEKVRTMM